VTDISVRKTPRYRANGTDLLERRKSRRHSTGTAPSITSPAVPPPPPPPLPSLSYSPPAQTLDEDSSSSQNSNELNGVFRECRDKGKNK